jgi:Putative zinc finger in N-recognin (UBR box)
MARQSKKRSRQSTGRARARPHYPCTFELGYVRQDVYSCTKCAAADEAPAGFCGGCKAACHGDHLESVVELYSKRAFRCDCGNGRMSNTCVLDPSKPDSNPDNALVYSHNFAGRYCRCDRGFDPKLGDMSQCAMCEDWFHANCLFVAGMGKKTAIRALRSKLYEFTCRECVSKLPSLQNYYLTTLSVFSLPKGISVVPADPPAGRPSDCIFPTVSVDKMPANVDFFWTPGFREKLCVCSACKELYASSGVSFLADIEDLVAGSVSQPDSDIALLDATADAQIVIDVLAESDSASPRAASRRRIDAGLPTEANMTGADAGTVLAEPGVPAAAATADMEGLGASEGRKESQASASVAPYDAAVGASDEERQQHQIQARIRDFLQRSIESNGRSLNHATIRSYLADLKADLLSSFSRNRGSPASDAAEVGNTP